MSHVVGRYRRRSAEVDALLTEAYVAGVSHSKAGELRTVLLGERVSRWTVSRVAEPLDEQVAALQRAPIPGEHPYWGRSRPSEHRASRQWSHTCVERRH